MVLILVLQDCYKQHKTCDAGLINAETYIQVGCSPACSVLSSMRCPAQSPPVPEGMAGKDACTGFPPLGASTVTFWGMLRDLLAESAFKSCSALFRTYTIGLGCMLSGGLYIECLKL